MGADLAERVERESGGQPPAGPWPARRKRRIEKVEGREPSYQNFQQPISLATIIRQVPGSGHCR